MALTSIIFEGRALINPLREYQSKKNVPIIIIWISNICILYYNRLWYYDYIMKSSLWMDLDFDFISQSAFPVMDKNNIVPKIT